MIDLERAAAFHQLPGHQHIAVEAARKAGGCAVFADAADGRNPGAAGVSGAVARAALSLNPGASITEDGAASRRRHAAAAALVARRSNAYEAEPPGNGAEAQHAVAARFGARAADAQQTFAPETRLADAADAGHPGAAEGVPEAGATGAAEPAAGDAVAVAALGRHRVACRRARLGWPQDGQPIANGCESARNPVGLDVTGDASDPFTVGESVIPSGESLVPSP